MNHIKIIDKDFNFLGQIDDYESFRYVRNYSKVKDFEIHINASKQHTEHLTEGNIVFISPYKAGIILHREISTEDNEKIVVKGLNLKSIIQRRVTVPPTAQAYDYIKDTVENVMKHFVINNCITPTDQNRAIPNLVIGGTKNIGGVTSFQTRFKNLSDEIEKISESGEIGWDVYLDIKNKKMVFDVFEGRDLTTEQNSLPPAIFSIDFNNIESQTHISSSFDYRNFGYVGGQGDGADRNILGFEKDGSVGIDRREVFIDARDLENGDDLIDRGKQKLDEYQKVFTFDNDIIENVNLKYGIDYDLGDRVTARNNKWGTTIHSRITEIVEVYEGSGMKISATFGSNMLGITDKIKRSSDIPIIEPMTASSTTEPPEPTPSKSYTHTQISPSKTWIVTHNLSKKPTVTIVDSAGTMVIGDVQYRNDTQLIITFTAEFAGVAYLN